MLYFYSETNEWLKDWVTWWVLPFSATTSCHFTWKKTSDLIQHYFYKALILSNWVNVARVVASFPIQSAQAVAAVLEHWPKSLAIDFALQSKSSIVFWNSLQEWWLLDDLQGLELGLKLELCCLTNGVQKFYLLWSPSIKLYIHIYSNFLPYIHREYITAKIKSQ